MSDISEKTSILKPQLYCELRKSLEALFAGERRPIPNMANAAALIGITLPDINWAGFYTAQEGELVLGPFWGRPACITIAWGRGVCGAAAMEKRTVRVQDVSKFSGHIACDERSRSEIVLPVFRADGSVAAVLDIDSPTLCRFDDEDERGLAAVVEAIARSCDF